MTKKIRAIGAAVLVAAWIGLTTFAWLHPAGDMSETERRPLAQFPGVTWDALMSGKFMTDFESYTLDQFPARDCFRQLKSLVHYRVFGQKDNNGIYIHDGYAAKLDFPMNSKSLSYALGRLEYVYKTYLEQTGCKVYTAVIPDKSYYLARQNGYPAMDYTAFFEAVKQGMPYATHIDITGCLEIGDYYFTDTHWRQEALLPTAEKLCSAMGVTAPKAEEMTKTRIEKPFYGVYYGQAALPMASEDLYVMQSALLSDCKVFNYETHGYTQVYDMEKVNSKDLYDVFLSGPQALLQIENPNAATDRELIIFRDSFGSSIAPLLVQDYKTVTLVDIRYLGSQLLGKHLEFNGQDVLFLYSTLVLNNGTTLK